MCGGAWENVRYIPIDNGIQAAWQDMAVYGWCCVYIGTPMQQVVYLCTICKHSIQPPSPELRNARVRVSRARVRACVRALYYYIIIILLYYYIYIYPIYPVYPVYLIYPIYPIMVI